MKLFIHKFFIFKFPIIICIIDFWRVVKLVIYNSRSRTPNIYSIFYIIYLTCHLPEPKNHCIASWPHRFFLNIVNIIRLMTVHMYHKRLNLPIPNLYYIQLWNTYCIMFLNTFWLSWNSSFLWCLNDHLVWTKNKILQVTPLIRTT